MDNPIIVFLIAAGQVTKMPLAEDNDGVKAVPPIDPMSLAEEPELRSDDSVSPRSEPSNESVVSVAVHSSQRPR